MATAPIPVPLSVPFRFSRNLRWVLISTTVLLSLIIWGLANDRAAVPSQFPAGQEFLDLLRTTPAMSLLPQLTRLASSTALPSSWARQAWLRLEEIERTSSGVLKTQAQLVRTQLFSRYGYPEQSLQEINRALAQDSDAGSQADILFTKANLAYRFGFTLELSSAVAQLRLLKVDDEALEDYADLASNPARVQDSSGIFHPVLWLVLLLLPAVAGWWRFRSLVRSIPSEGLPPDSLPAVQSAQMNLFLTIFSMILVVAFDEPRRLGFPGGTATGAISHVLLAYGLCLIPQHAIDRLVRKSSWSFWNFASTVLRFNLVALSPYLCVGLALAILKGMTTALPFWPVLFPWGIGFGLPALAGVFLLLLPLTFPRILGLDRLPAGVPDPLRQGPGKRLLWPLSGSGIHNAISFGYLSPTHGIAFSEPLLQTLPPEETLAIAAHEEGHLELGHLLLFFLYLFNLLLVGGVYAAWNPLGFQKLLMSGMTPLQGIGILGGIISGLALFKMISRRCELDADRFATTKVDRETLLKALSRLTELNREPSGTRRSAAYQSHPALIERKIALRDEIGTTCEPTGFPEPFILASLWRARLSVEWKSGLAEASHLLAIDYDIPETEKARKWSFLAGHHARLGAECLVRYGEQDLAVMICAQKAAVKSAEPPLPVEKVCQICREGMAMVLSQEIRWQETPSGCTLRGK